jgi:predicted RecB family nuclease
MTEAVEAANSLQFWRWLMNCRAIAHGAGKTFRAYCYNANAENVYLRRLGLATGVEQEIESFIASDEWVDLLRVWDSQLITGGSSGLKAVAPLAGFHWDVDDAGGTDSMLKHEVAVSNADDADQARLWLLKYNRGDVEATLAVRKWIDAAAIPGIETTSVEFWQPQ